MRKVKIIVDSSCDLSPEIMDAMNLHMVPLYIIFGDDSYKDGAEMKPAELFNEVEARGNLPKTSAVTPIDFEDTFKRYTSEGYDILCFTISTGFSSTYQNAVLASREIDEGFIRIVDSKNLSAGIGILITHAYDLIKEGYTIEEAAQAVEGLRDQVKTSFIVDTLDYLHKGGRCSSTKAVVSAMLNIRPIIKVKDGGMIIGAKIRGKKKKGIDYMINEVLEHKDELLGKRLFITHSLGSEEEEKYIREQLEEHLPEHQIITTHASGLISCHCGKKTIGIIHLIDKKTA